MSNNNVVWMETTRQNFWQHNNEIKINTANNNMTSMTNLKITEQQGRVVEGFGSCFNELGMFAIEHLSEEDRHAVLDSLFALDGDCKFTLCRLPIGASDYALEWYSHNEHDDDYEMKHFSIERDHKYLIPYIKEAQKRNPKLTFFASPWSPPTWMKTPKAYNFGTLRWEKKILEAYALYFVKFIQAYEQEGIRINQIHIQNEVVADQKFPSCKWTGEQLQEFIRDYLGPAFKQYQLDTEIWLGTINAPEPWQELLTDTTSDYDAYAGLVLSDPEAYQYIHGVGYQWAGKHAIQRTVASYPELRYLQTENECGNGKNTWEYAQYVSTLFHHYFVNGANGYVYWNAILEPKGSSTWGWEQNSMITVDPETKKYSFNPEFYVVKHHSHFVQNGAVRLVTSGRFTSNSLVFQNPDQSVVLIVNNPLKDAQQLSFEFKGKSYQLELKPESFNSVVLS
ncbi:glycoside hydrolase family 30 beta sandwich domain-containing protein [Paenibacillus turicensis]|uniref:glycoside hydrolase family 30 protein n=1 Tax=Paenibacillus turicensis TaxID=160487 RepID=UPI003D28004F